MNSWNDWFKEHFLVLIVIASCLAAVVIWSSTVYEIRRLQSEISKVKVEEGTKLKFGFTKEK